MKVGGDRAEEVVNSAIRQLYSEPAEGYLVCELRADKALFTTHDVLSLGNKQLVMSFTNKPSVTLTLDQVVELVDQLSPADKLKVAKRIQKNQRSKDVDRLVEILSKVKISEKQLTAMVEEERAKIHAREQARPARR